MNKWGVSILAALLLLCLAAGAMAAEERVRLGDYADVSYTLQADRYGTSLPDVVEDGQSLFLQLAFDLIVQDETYLLRKAYQNGEISPDTIFTVDIGSLHLMNDANYPTSYDDEDNIASDAGVNIFRWWVDEEAGQICLRYYENVYSDDGNVSNTKVAFDGSLDTSSHNDDGQLRFEVNGETETLIVRQEYELNKEAGIPYYSTDASSYLVDYTVTLTLDQNMSLSQGTTGNLYGAALTLVDTVAADGALTGELFGDATVTAPAGEQAAIASVNNGSVNTLTLSSPDGILNKGTYTFVYRMKVDSEAALAKLEGYTEAQRTNAVELKENGASLRTPLTAAASIGWDEVTVHQFGIDKNAFTDHTEAYGGAYMDERDKKYYVDFRVTVYIKEPFSTFTVVDNVNYALSFRSPDERPVTLEGVDTSDSFLTNDPKTANLTRVDAIVTNTVDGGRNTITLTAPEGEMLPPGAYQLRVPADITSAVRSAQAKNYPQYYSNTASLIKVDDYAPNVSKEWKSLVPTYETPTKAGGYEVDPVTGKLFFYEGKPLIRWDVYFGWNFYDKTTFIDTLTGMDLLVNSDYPFEIHSFDSRNTYKERLYSLTDLTDTSFIDFNDAGNGFTFTTENLDINSDGTYVKLYKLVYFATPSVNADGSYVTEGIKNGYKVIHTDPFGNGFADGPITGEEEPTMTSNARLIVEKRHVIERTDSLTQWKITCKNSNKTPFELFGDLDIVDLVPRGQTPIGEVTIHYSDKWPIEVEMVCGNNQKVPLTEGTHYQILKSHPKHDFGENGKYGFAVDLDMEAVAAILEEKNATTFETIDVTCYLNNETHAPGQNYRIKNDGWLNYTNQGTELVEGINAHYDRGFATRRKETPAYGDYYDPTAFRNYTVCTVNGNSAQAFTGGYDDNPANGDGVEEIRWKIFIGAREFGNDGDPITVTVTDTLSDNQMLPSYAGRPLKDLFLIEAEDAPGYIIVPDSVSVSGNTFTLTFTIPGGGWAGNSKDKSKDIYITYHTMLKPEAIRDAMDEVPIDAAEIVLNYSNTATISWNGESYTLPTSRGSTSLNSSMMDKTAEFLQSSGRKVEYTIEMNPFGLDLDRNSDVILLEDQMGAGKDVFTYVDGSFRVVNTRVGRQLSAASSASATSYVLTMAEDGKSFTLDVPDNTPLKLTYQAKTTLPVGTKDVSLINNACLAGRKPQAESITFNVTSSNQSGSYSVLPHEAGIRLLKISSEGAGSNSPTFLPGAQFRVTTLDQDFGPGASETLTTKAGGVIEITKVPEGAMILVIEETMAPDGYRLGAAPWKWCYVLLSENAEFSDEDMAALKAAVGCSVTTIRAGSYVEDTITNDPVSLVVRKVDPDGNLLTGAMFTLKKGSTPIDHSYTHNAPGELLFEDLTAGSYTLEETEAPDGFDISEEDPWSFTLDANGSVVLTETYQDLTLSEDGLYLEVLNVPEYNAEGEIQLGAVKTLNGRTLEAEQFSFELYDAEGNEIETVKNAADGSIAFTTLHYTEEDLEKSPIAYTVKEVKGNAAGYTYDEAEYTVNVTLTDNGDGTITATADKEAAEVAFTNSYKAEGEIQLGAVKTLTGGTLEAEQFSFELLDAEDNVIETVKNAADGSITFTTLTYTREDLEKSPIAYTVKEVKGDAAGYTYDEAEYTVNVTLTDNGDGTITATADKEAAEVAFANAYEAKGEIQLGAVKTLNGRTLEAEQFSFELLDAEGDVIETVKNAADGGITFTTLTYTGEDLEKSPIAYTVKEVKGNAAGYTYDETGYTVTVTLTDNGDGTITAAADKEAAEVAFANAYEAAGEWSPTAIKTVNGAEPREDQVYEFILTDAAGNTIRAENAGGEITFGTLTYGLSDVGQTYTYTVREITESTDMMAADESIYTVNVTVSDNHDGTLNVEPVITRNGEPAEEIRFENTLYASLTISKMVEGCETDRTFRFTVELFHADGTEAEGEYAYTGDAEGMIRSGDTIGLAHDQSVTISGLLPGMRYTVTEAASAAFEVTVNGEAGGSIEGELPEDGAEVSFVNELMTTEFMVTKSWQGGDGGAIELTLYANGKKLDPQPDYTRDGNVYRYVDLPMYDERDQLIVYYAKEKYVDGFLTIYVNVPPYAGKTKAIYNGGTIINKAVVKADFAVRKTWSGLTEGEAAPEIELVLYCNGEPTDIRTPKPDRNGWYKYYNLPGEVNGQPAVYTVREQPLSGFVTRYTLKDGTPADHADNGGTIINARIPQNGDETSLALWVALMGASAAMLTLLRRRRRA
ncbi:MAG: Cna B-type domain-containing protein [Clostridia bacterium]|nr:Cna B-type domain-containing protein [Clostridia bacterium]